MLDFFVPELVDVFMSERLKDAASIRVSREPAGRTGHGRLRSRLAAILAVVAVTIQPEAARAAVGLGRVPNECDRSPPCGLSFCLCDE